MENNKFNTCGALLVGVISVSLFSLLFIFNTKLGENVYSVLIGFSFLLVLAVYFGDSIKEFNLKELKLILGETKGIKQGIDAVSLALAESMAHLSVYSSGTHLNRKELNDKIESILNASGVDKAKKESILRLPRLMEKFMKNSESLTSAEKEEIEQVFKV